MQKFRMFDWFTLYSITEVKVVDIITHYGRISFMYGLNIYRRVVPEASPRLADIQETAKFFPEVDFQEKRLGRYAVTLVEKSELENSVRNHFKHRDGPPPQWKLLDRLSRPMPTSGHETLTLPIAGLDTFGSKIFMRSLALVLGDPDNILASERHALESVFPRNRWKPFIPHISIAAVDTLQINGKLLRWYQDNAPDTVTLEPVNILQDPNTAAR